jgi:hypothetical protein
MTLFKILRELELSSDRPQADSARAQIVIGQTTGSVSQEDDKLFIKFRCGEGQLTNVHEPLIIAGRWAHAKGKFNAWVTKDKQFEAYRLRGDL